MLPRDAGIVFRCRLLCVNVESFLVQQKLSPLYSSVICKKSVSVRELTETLVDPEVLKQRCGLSREPSCVLSHQIRVWVAT